MFATETAGHNISKSQHPTPVLSADMHLLKMYFSKVIKIGVQMSNKDFCSIRKTITFNSA